MQTRNRFFDDAAKMAGGAIGTLEGLRREIEALVAQQVEKIFAKFDALEYLSLNSYLNSFSLITKVLIFL